MIRGVFTSRFSLTNEAKRHTKESLSKISSSLSRRRSCDRLGHRRRRGETQEKWMWSGGFEGFGGGGGGVPGGAEKSKTSPFNFLKTFQHLFCTLTYANSKGPQWLGSHFRPSVEPESSSAVKWERRSAVWKWISLAEIRGALSEPCTAFNGEKELLYKLFLVH